MRDGMGAPATEHAEVTRPLRPAARRATVPDTAEQRVIRQLVEALLFEGLARRAVPSDAHDTLAFDVGRRRFRCTAAIRGFGRVRVAEGSVTCVQDGPPRQARLDEIVRALDLDAESATRLLDELAQTVELSRWNRENLPHQRAPRRDLDFPALESAIVEGHPYHPCFKTRTGFSLADHQDFGPEAGRAFPLEWLGVARRTVRLALPTDEGRFWRREIGDATYEVLCTRLRDAGGDPGSHVLVPIHPWQRRAIGALGLDRAIAEGAMIPLGAAGDHYRATQSVRTLVNVTRPEKANVKLPLDVVCTSTRRNLVPPFVCSAPALSRWLIGLVATDPFLAARGDVIMLDEYAGIVHEPETSTTDDDRARLDLQGRIGVLFRESLCAKLVPGETAVPFSAITLIESDGRPFVADWVDAHGARRWLERLLDVTLVPIWHLLVHHGVAFESHAQNLALVLRDGWPTKIVLRDFHEDTEFVPDFLRDPLGVPDFASLHPFFATAPDDDGYRMASVESLRELFLDTVCVYVLADVSFLFERHFGVDDASFWAVVRERLAAYAASGVTDPRRIHRLGCDAPEVLVESLLTKKLANGRRLDFFAHRVPNPLCG